MAIADAETYDIGPPSARAGGKWRRATMAAVLSRLATMLRLTTRRRDILADKLLDVANLIAAAIVIGIVLGEPNVSLAAVFATLGIWMTVLGFALWITEG